MKHYAEEPSVWRGYGGEITQYPCGCGDSFAAEDELQDHLNKKEARHKMTTDATQKQEIIPSLDMPGFGTALVTGDQIEQRIIGLAKLADSLEIVGEPSRTQAGQLTKQLKDEAKQAEATLSPYLIIVDRVRNFIRDRKTRAVNIATNARESLADKMAAYDRAEEQRAAAEAQRKQKEVDEQNRRLAEEKRKADAAAAEAMRKDAIADAKADFASGRIGKREYAKRLKEAGAAAEAAKAQAEAEAEDAAKNPPKVTVAANIPKVAGNVRRVNYSAECADTDAFIGHLCRAYQKDKELFLRLRAMLVVSNTALSAEARRVLKTHPQDDKHELTVEAFEARYLGTVKVKEDRSY